MEKKYWQFLATIYVILFLMIICDHMKEHIKWFLETQAESVTPHSNENEEPAIPNVMSNLPQEPIVIDQPGMPLQPHLDTNASIYFPNTATTSVPVQAGNQHHPPSQLCCNSL